MPRVDEKSELSNLTADADLVVQDPTATPSDSGQGDIRRIKPYNLQWFRTAAFNSTIPSDSTITMTSDLTGIIMPGYGIKL